MRGCAARSRWAVTGVGGGRDARDGNSLPGPALPSPCPGSASRDRPPKRGHCPPCLQPGELASQLSLCPCVEHEWPPARRGVRGPRAVVRVGSVALCTGVSAATCPSPSPAFFQGGFPGASVELQKG